jgi:hypothetical protein
MASKVPRDQVLDWAYSLIPVRQPPLAIGEREDQVAARLVEWKRRSRSW